MIKNRYPNKAIRTYKGIYIKNKINTCLTPWGSVLSSPPSFLFWASLSPKKREKEPIRSLMALPTPSSTPLGVSVYIEMYKCICIYVYVYVYIYIWKYMHTIIYIYPYILVYIFTYTDINTYTYVYSYLIYPAVAEWSTTRNGVPSHWKSR
jgi:hypothetical protein